jgi:hypothetical protein
VLSVIESEHAKKIKDQRDRVNAGKLKNRNRSLI